MSVALLKFSIAQVMGYARESISILAGYKALKTFPFLMHVVEDLI